MMRRRLHDARPASRFAAALLSTASLTRSLGAAMAVFVAGAALPALADGGSGGGGAGAVGGTGGNGSGGGPGGQTPGANGQPGGSAPTGGGGAGGAGVRPLPRRAASQMPAPSRAARAVTGEVAGANGPLTKIGHSLTSACAWTSRQTPWLAMNLRPLEAG
jgi:hypothetical protein